MIQPSHRTIVGSFAIIAIIIAWAVLVVMAVEQIADWPLLVQMGIYLAAGVAWVIPLGPLLRWMQTGHFRR